jgi:hypothetical protein
VADDGRTYIRVHDGMPDHPKVETLSDRAFRLLIETWCWSARHLTDGRMPRAVWNRRATPKARRELVDAGLVIDHGPDGIEMHDYLQHQRSRAEVAEISANRRAASIKANHTRWHTGPKGKPDSACPLCNGSESDPETESVNGSVSVPIDRDTDRDTVKNSPGDSRRRPADSNTRRPRRPREHTPPADLDATATSPVGYRLVQTWAQRNPGLTSGKRRDLGKAVDQLLAQGADPALIPAALDAAHHSRFRNPTGALPHAYDDVRRARTPTAEPLHPTDARIQALLQGTPTDLPPAIGGPS